MKPKNRRPLLRVVTTNAIRSAPDQVTPTADLLPVVDWVSQYSWRVEHASDGQVLIRQRDQTIALRPHEIAPLLAALYRSVEALESARRKLPDCRGRP